MTRPKITKDCFFFRKLIGKVAELEFITAPHIIPSDNPEEQVGED